MREKEDQLTIMMILVAIYEVLMITWKNDSRQKRTLSINPGFSSSSTDP